MRYISCYVTKFRQERSQERVFNRGAPTPDTPTTASDPTVETRSNGQMCETRCLFFRHVGGQAVTAEGGEKGMNEWKALFFAALFPPAAQRNENPTCQWRTQGTLLSHHFTFYSYGRKLVLGSSLEAKYQSQDKMKKKNNKT